MNRSQKKKFNLVILFTLLCVCCSAQNTFKYQSVINKISVDGLYKIYLSPNIIARCKANLSDLRIIDARKKFVPYANGAEFPGDYKNFIVFPNLYPANANDSSTIVIVQNLSLEPINLLWLQLKNAAVERKADLLGSDDRVNWYAIKESIPLAEANEMQSDYYFQSISFPASTYKYFKIKIDNKKKNPLNVIQVGIYQNKPRLSRYDKLPNPLLVQKDSVNNITYLDLRFNSKYQLNKLRFDITAPKYYKRQVSIFEVCDTQKNLIEEAELISGNENDFYISTKTNKLYIEIENDDNTPLTINRVEAYQRRMFIVAYLEQHVTYRLIFDDPSAKLPHYDLAFFTKKNNIVSELGVSSISENVDFKPQKVAVKSDYRILMWVGLSVAVLLLSFLTFRMVNEMKGEK